MTASALRAKGLAGGGPLERRVRPQRELDLSTAAHHGSASGLQNRSIEM